MIAYAFDEIILIIVFDQAFYISYRLIEYYGGVQCRE